MYLLDPAPPPMERGTPQRKTVYRISLTLVKKELLADTRLERCPEEEGEEQDTFPPHPGLRNFRTRSTGQLELGRLRVSRTSLRTSRTRTGDTPEDKSPISGDHVLCTSGEDRVPPVPGSPWSHHAVVSEAGGSPSNVNQEASGQKQLHYNVSCSPQSEEASSTASGSTSESAVDWAKGGLEGTWEKRHPSLLRRSFSFRHWNGELLKIRSLTREKHHSSSSCLSHQRVESREPLSMPTTEVCPAEKRNTLDVGEVLNKSDPLTDLERWERSKSKNRTLDNSDLHKLSEQMEMDRKGQERKLLRFFSGIFSRKDGTLLSFTSPGGRSPRTGHSRSRGYFSSLKRPATDNIQSSSESVNGSPYKGALF